MNKFQEFIRKENKNTHVVGGVSDRAWLTFWAAFVLVIGGGTLLFLSLV